MRKKIDNRIRTLIENGVNQGWRSLFVVVGDKGKDQIVILHHMLAKAQVKSRPNVLWCYKKDLGFSSHRKKRMKQLQKKMKQGQMEVNEDDPFELFIASTNIRYCYYNETHKILGNTFGMCILQDFEALTPNLLARTVETVEGGGIVVLLLRSVQSLKQLYTMTMDVHARYRTEAHADVVGRFNERFILSLASCKSCLVMDDQLNILPISSNSFNITPVPPRSSDDPLPPNEEELKATKESLQDTQPVGVLVNCCRTLDQAKAVLKFIDAISEKTLKSTVSLTAARGRGKSAALGLAMAGAVAFGYSNIFVTSPSPENLHTLFEFVFKGFDALEYQEHIDYDIIQSTNPEFNKAVVRVNIYRDHRQTIQYIHPGDAQKLGQAELVVIDEAAAIPLPLVKSLLGPYLVFMASTINGYEGTGRSLSLKLLEQLRIQSNPLAVKAEKSTKDASLSGRTLAEVTLEESIRYRPGDQIEKWLNDILCLDATLAPPITSGCPPPTECELYYVNRDTLFCYHKATESFLHKVMALFVSSHYKNTPNDLQMLSDAPAHHLFVLLGPMSPDSAKLPDVLCAIQVCLEGEISKNSIIEGLSRGKRASGDLIPWTIAQQYQDRDFPSLSGARVVRIATHPDYQGLGYGARALALLRDYYEGKTMNLTEEKDEKNLEVEPVPDEEVGLLKEKVGPRKNLPPLLMRLHERSAERLDYLGVSFGLTAPLLKFWKRAGYVPVYLRQTANELTGEHSCIMLLTLHTEEVAGDWLVAFWKDFKRRIVHLMGYQFRDFSPALGLSLMTNKAIPEQPIDVTKEELSVDLTPYDLRRLEMYASNMADYHLIVDLLPAVAKLYFLGKMGEVHFSAAQAAILLGLGLQHKTVDQLAKELELPATQLLGLFNRAVRRASQYFRGITENAVAEKIGIKDGGRAPLDVGEMQPMKQTLDEELEEAAKTLKDQQKKELEKLKKMDLSQYQIKGSENEWAKALDVSKGSILSIKSGEKRPLLEEPEEKEEFREDKKRGKKDRKEKKFKKNKR